MDWQELDSRDSLADGARIWHNRHGQHRAGHGRTAGHWGLHARRPSPLTLQFHLSRKTQLNSTLLNPTAMAPSLLQHDAGFSIMPRNPKKKMCQTYKVIVLGDSDVGKSSLLRQLTNFEPLSPADSVPSDYLSKMAIVEGAPAPVKVQLWDTAGQEKFGAARLPSSYFRHANAAIVVYDVTNRLSFAAVLRWVMQIQAYRSTAVADSLFSIVLVGSKSDAACGSRQVEEEEGRQVSRIIGASCFFECSSRDGINTQECFNAVATLLVNGASWSLPCGPPPSTTLAATDLLKSPSSAAKTRGLLKDAAPLDVVTPTLSTTAALSPTLRVLSAKSGPPAMGTSHLGALAV